MNTWNLVLTFVAFVASFALAYALVPRWPVPSAAEYVMPMPPADVSTGAGGGTMPGSSCRTWTPCRVADDPLECCASKPFGCDDWCDGKAEMM